MHIYYKEFVLACLAANKDWAEGEGVFIKKFQNGDGINKKDFNLFLNRWQVMRNTVKTKREELRGFLNATSFNGPACVENAAKHARDNGYSTKVGKEKTISLPTSLISKVAFYKNPNDITPVDKYSLKAIRKCMPKGNDLPKTTHEYSKYLVRFNILAEAVKLKLEGHDWTTTTFNFGGVEVPESYFHRRVTDKYLMIIGAKNKVLVAERLDSSKDTFDETAYAILGASIKSIGDNCI